MKEFKFVCRENEIQNTIHAMESNSLVILHSYNNSGQSHFLKRVMQLFWKDNSTGFYIDGESQRTVAEQIVGQVIMYSKDDSPEQNRAAKILKKKDKGDIVFAVITSCLYALDTVPLLPNIGTIANSLVLSIKETLDTDLEHLNDFKMEKAVAHFFQVLAKNNVKANYFLVDNPQLLRESDISFLSFLISHYHAHALFAFNINSRFAEIEFISKFPCHDNLSLELFHTSSFEFMRPDDQLIEAL